MAGERDSLRFSTADLPLSGPTAFEAYHDLYAPVADATLLNENFAVEVDAHRLDQLIVFDRRMRGVSHGRGSKRVARNGFDHFTAQLALEGSFLVATPGSDRRVETGELALIDMSRPMETRIEAGRVLTLSIPRAEIEAISGNERALHGSVLPRDRTRLLAQFMTAFLQEPGDFVGADRGRLARVTSELLGIALSDHPRAAVDVPAPAAAAICKLKARRFIDANPAVDPTALARAVGVSRSVLYRVLEAEGGVASFIRSRRLLRLRAMLSNPADARTIRQMADACGFASDSDCIRAFRSQYGLTPGDYRKLRREGAGLESPDVQSGLARWWNELR